MQAPPVLVHALTEVCLSALQSPHAGFNLTDLYDLFNPDRLHMGPKGILERIVKYIKAALVDVGSLQSVNEALLASPRFPGCRVTSKGLEWDKITATEMAVLARVLVVPLADARSDVSGRLEDLGELLQGRWAGLANAAVLRRQCCIP